MKVKEYKILEGFKKKVCSRYPDAEIILFGSKARGEDSEESDVDIIVLLDKYSERCEDRIRDMAFEIEVRYAIMISLLFYRKDLWNSPAYRLLELHHWVEEEGVRL